jgi:hypothetical protein
MLQTRYIALKVVFLPSVYSLGGIMSGKKSIMPSLDTLGQYFWLSVKYIYQLPYQMSAWKGFSAATHSGCYSCKLYMVFLLSRSFCCVRLITLPGSGRNFAEFLPPPPVLRCPVVILATGMIATCGKVSRQTNIPFCWSISPI